MLKLEDNHTTTCGDRRSTPRTRALARAKEKRKDTLATLYQVMAAVESGEMEPAWATAIIAVSRAIVGVCDAGLVESKIAELEDEIAMKAASRRRS